MQSRQKSTAVCHQVFGVLESLGKTRTLALPEGHEGCRSESKVTHAVLAGDVFDTGCLKHRQGVKPHGFKSSPDGQQPQEHLHTCYPDPSGKGFESQLSA